MISTRDLSELPDIHGFVRLTSGLAMLDAILSPDWEYRYYSFNSHWGTDEKMASMRNGSGDHWFALIAPYGVALHGLSHEAPTFQPGSPGDKIFGDLPTEFHASFLNEPAFDTENSTFCIWRRAADRLWSCGVTQWAAGDDPDGSRDLLAILEGKPEQYVEFAADYFEREIRIADVSAVYQHQPLSTKLVHRLNPEASVESLSSDIKEIGYPMSNQRGR